MDLDTKKQLAAEINHHLDHGTTDMAADVMYSATGRYSDPHFLSRETAVLFRRYPLVLGHVSTIPEPGDFVTHELAGLPLIALRQPDGKVRTFLNACRHRGARLVHDGSGNRRAALVCRYHAWSYGLDGALKTIAGDEGFCSLDRSMHSLVEFPTEVRHGLIWSVLTPGADLDVAGYLGKDLDRELGGYRIENHSVAREAVVREPINWKMVLDGFLENYHFRSLHAKTVGPYYQSNLCVFDDFGPHVRNTVVRSTFDRVRGVPVDQFELLDHVTVGYIIFPNTVLLSVGDRDSSHFEMWTSFAENGSPDRVAARAQLLVPSSDSRTPERDAFWDKNWKVAMGTILDEDLWICHGSQECARTGLLQTYAFGRNEPALQHFHRQVDLAVGGAK